MNRRDVLGLVVGAGAAGGIGSFLYRHYHSAASLPPHKQRESHGQFPVQLVNVADEAGIHLQHNGGAFGKKYLPERLGSGCAYLDYDSDGWQDILLINGMDWPGHKRQRSTLRLYRNNRNGTFTDVTKSAGLDVEMYGMGVAVGDYNNDGFPDIFITCVGQSRLFRNTGKGAFVDATRPSGLFGRQGLSTSALWF